MTRQLLGAAGMMSLGIAGCVSLDPHARVDEATGLVEQTLGQRPEWTVPWDEDRTTWDGERVLTLERALVAALRNDRALRADLETIGQANADLAQATLFSNPAINFMVMFPSGGGRSMLRGSGLPMQPLQDLWLIPVRKEVAQRELQQAILRVADRAVETAAQVKRVYARLQYTQRAIELIRANIAVVDQSTEIIRIQQAAGQSTQVQVTLSQIRSMRLRSDLIATEADDRRMKRELLMLMGMPSAPDEWSVEPIQESVYPATPPLPEPALLELADGQRLDLQAAEWMVRAAEERIRLRRREGWPDVALGLGFERSPAPRSNNPSLAGQAGNAAYQGASGALSGGMGGGGGMGSGPFAPKMRDVKYTLGPMIDLEIPLFDWGQAQTARALHEYRQRLAEYDALAQQIIRQVRQTRVDSQQAYEQLILYRESIIPEVERNLELAQQSFVAGEENVTVYLDVQEDLIMTRLRLLEFLRDYLVNQAELERQVGGKLDAEAMTESDADGTPRGSGGQAEGIRHKAELASE